MSSRRMSEVCGLVCLLISIHVSAVVGQTINLPEMPLLGASLGRRWIPAGSANQDCWSVASFTVGWMTAPQRIHVGYDGLVLPGACVSSFFVSPLSGVQALGSSRSLADHYTLECTGLTSSLTIHKPAKKSRGPITLREPENGVTAIRSGIKSEGKCCIECPARRLWWAVSDWTLSLPTSAIQTRITSLLWRPCRRRPR